MGLDMYMFRDKKPEDTNNFKPQREQSEDGAMEEVAYWRKANHIHGWFVKHLDDVDNCEYSYASKEKIQELILLCERLIREKDDELSAELLPMQSGFFFGSTEIHEWFYEDLESTVKQLQSIMDTTNFDSQVIYYHPWW